MSNSITSNRSTLKEFLASIATIQGDLSNITAPPFVLGQYSTVELPQYWADHPSLFIAPALEQNAEKRAVLVLKWFLGSLKNQQYAGRREEDGVKKPLNAFLGEVFLGSWKDENTGKTKLVSEQVSHHPPVTACYLWNDTHGIRAEGFTQQEITFSGSVSIKQKGYAVLHIDRFDEDYLVPVPNVKVKGLLGGTPYPELVGRYCIVSSSGVVSKVGFEGKGFFGGGNKNGFEAKVYRVEAPDDTLYSAQGQWNGDFSIVDSRNGREVHALNTKTAVSLPITVVDQAEQDPWESRKAWGGVIEALGRGDMKGTSDAKSKVEQGQRHMRRDEEARGEVWQTVFFKRQKEDPLFRRLVAADDEKSFTVDPVGGIWKVDVNAIEKMKKPYHGGLLPTDQTSKSQSVQTQHRGNGPKSGLEAAQPLRSTISGTTQLPVLNEPEGGGEKEKLEKIHIEEMLRDMSSSVHR
jgi:hypothetical protein